MKHNRKIIYLAGFLFSIPIALTTYVNSSFLHSFTNDYFVSILYVLASLCAIIGMLKMPKVLTKLGNRKTTLSLSLLMFVSLIMLAFGTSKSIIFPAFILYFISSNFMIATIDIFLEDFSQSSGVGKFRGLYISVTYIAWVLSQMISGSIIAKSSFKGIYILSALFMLLVAVIFTLFLQNFVDPRYKKVPMWRTIKLFLQNKNISKIYFIDLIIKFFYAWMVIYTPIYLNVYLHFSWQQMGFIFTIMLTPFILLSFPLGKLSDKIGEKKILMTGLFIMSIATLLIPLTTGNQVWLWALILFATRVGAATSEVMTESYFFKVVSEENSGAISFFRNTSAMSYIIAPLLAIPILFYIPSFKYLFFILGAILLIAFWTSLRLRDVR